MKLMNFRRLDPLYTADGKVGLVRGAKTEEEVWAEFAGDVLRCAKVADAIMESVNDPAIPFYPADLELDGGMQEAAEGRLLTRKHVARERNKELLLKASASMPSARTEN